jgi:hypothetical protein
MKWIEYVRKWGKAPHVRRAGWIVAGCGVLALVSAPVAHGQLGADVAAMLSAMEDVDSTMQTVMAAPMKAMQLMNQQIATFTQSTVYPVAGITAAQSMATQSLTASQQSQQTMNTPISSAQVPVNQQFETSLLSGNPNSVSGVSGMYQQTYGPLPASTSAPSQTITAVDMGDAVAQESLKKAIQLDALAARETEVAQQLLTQLQTTAPGNAPIISAQAAAWILQGHGYTQSALAQVLRAQSASLAYTGVDMKQGSINNQNAGGAAFSLPAVPHP